MDLLIKKMLYQKLCIDAPIKSIKSIKSIKEKPKKKKFKIIQPSSESESESN